MTNIVLKSGTNDFHGQAYWFNRVSALSARAFYDPVRGHFVYNYFGGQFGGPIIRNRLFFFVNLLRQTDHRYAVDRYTLPTAAERAGDLGVSTTPIYDPNTGNPDGTGRTLFPDNRSRRTHRAALAEDHGAGAAAEPRRAEQQLLHSSPVHPQH